jgi:hypothetical protein
MKFRDSYRGMISFDDRQKDDLELLDRVTTMVKTPGSGPDQGSYHILCHQGEAFPVGVMSFRIRMTGEEILILQVESWNEDMDASTCEASRTSADLWSHQEPCPRVSFQVHISQKLSITESVPSTTWHALMYVVRLHHDDDQTLFNHPCYGFSVSQ